MISDIIHDPMAYAIGGLIAWCLGCLAFCASGIAELADTLRERRRGRA